VFGGSHAAQGLIRWRSEGFTGCSEGACLSLLWDDAYTLAGC
jgi:hypothetical protein